MRTTTKRALGRAWVDGRADAVLPPSPTSAIARYRQPVTRRSLGRVVGRVLVGVLLVLASVGLGAAGGSYLWLHESLLAVHAPQTAPVRAAEKQLHLALPGEPTTALVLGDNQRAGFEASAGGRSDTILLIRADPRTKTISLLSLPRDLRVPVYCPRSPDPLQVTRIDYAFAWCGAAGSLDTIKHLTGIPVNYLITVDFHGFKEIVNDIGGIWLDIDRRYYNENVGTAATDFSSINLQPGYQLLSGGAALSFVRFRHTDSDFYRQARQQEFLRALKDQVEQRFDPLDLPKLISAITSNIQVAGKVDDLTVLRYALFAATLPQDHILQNYVGDATDVFVGGADELQAPQSAIQQSVAQFENPDVGQTKAANDQTLGVKPKVNGPTPAQTTLTVLNGNGTPGAAATASYLLAQQHYRVLLPPHGLEPNAPSSDYFHTRIYYRRGDARAKSAADTLRNLLAPADVATLPSERQLLALDPGSLLLVVLGTTFHNALTETPSASTLPPPQPAAVRYAPNVTLPLLQPLVHRVPFRLELPSVLEESSSPDSCCGDVPVRLYDIVKGHKAVRLVYRMGTGIDYWGVEETDWAGAPILEGRSFQRVLAGRRFDLYYSGSHLHMIVLHAGGASYWVLNTLLDSLSNKTMLAIAKGLEPLSPKT